MKKYIIALLMLLSLSGCKSDKEVNIVSKLNKDINKASSYNIKGELELYNDDETFNYEVDVKYLEKNYYLINLNNKDTNKNQIILRNDDGLYVITPAINKSFKFDSNWPDNSSQVYILKSLLNDIKESEYEINKEEKSIKTDVNYPNNPELSYQKIYYTETNKIKKVEVYNKDNNIKIKFLINNYDLNIDIEKDEFKLNNYANNANETKDKNIMSSINDAIYPLYMPNNTYLNSSELVSNEDDSRIILTFSGENNFVIVEEPSVFNEELEIIPVSGNPIFINDSIGALSTNSIYWTYDNIDYYLTSKDLTNSELVSVASSIGNVSSVIANTK